MIILFFQINQTATGKFSLRKEVNQCNPIIHCHFTNRTFDFFTPKDMFLYVFQQVFGSNDMINELTFGWTFDPPLKNYVYSIEFLTSVKSQPCNCFLFQEYCSTFSGFGEHVCTTDLTLLKNKEIQDLLSKGFNHIPLQPLNPHLAFASLLTCLANIANMLNLDGLQHARLSDSLFAHFQSCIRSIPVSWLSKETT